MRRFALMLKKIVVYLFVAALPVVAQVAAPGNVPQSQASSAPQMQPVPYGLSQSLAQLDQLSQTTVRDLSRVRVDKWKADQRFKDQSRGNAESIQRNMNAALPTLVQQLRTTPASLVATIKLYRNLNALYDVMASFTESAGAFGSKDDYNALANDVASLETVRRSLADQLEQLAANQDAQVARLTAQLQARQQAASVAATPAKRVVVDDNAPAKKVAKKKPVPQPKPQ